MTFPSEVTGQAMTECNAGRFCPACHPLRAAAVYVALIGGYIGFLWAVLSWMP